MSSSRILILLAVAGCTGGGSPTPNVPSPDADADGDGLTLEPGARPAKSAWPTPIAFDLLAFDHAATLPA